MIQHAAVVGQEQEERRRRRRRPSAAPRRGHGVEDENGSNDVPCRYRSCCCTVPNDRERKGAKKKNLHERRRLFPGIRPPPVGPVLQMLPLVLLLIPFLMDKASGFAGFGAGTAGPLRRGGAGQRHPRCGSTTSTALNGIVGFRGWFESRFGSAVAVFPSVRKKPQKKKKNKKRGGSEGTDADGQQNGRQKKEKQKQKDSGEDSEKDGDEKDDFPRDVFDHVLIDVNPLLHTCMRRSRSDEHGLVLLFGELDACLRQVVPRKSVVLAMDGPPSAAKMATQRKRRRQVLAKAQFELEQLDRARRAELAAQANKEAKEEASGETDGGSGRVDRTTAAKAAATFALNESSSAGGNSTSATTATAATTTVLPLRKWLLSNQGRGVGGGGGTRRKKRAKSWATRRRQAAADTRTLAITPGTDFMKLAERAVMYWAWQRLDSRRPFGDSGSGNSANNPRINVYLSSSAVPGEGEVKLLEWLYQHRRHRRSINRDKREGDGNGNGGGGGSQQPHRQQQESAVLLGGDSDLVLEALMVDPFRTDVRDLFVMLPEGDSRTYMCVSTWETTRKLADLIFSSKGGGGGSGSGSGRARQPAAPEGAGAPTISAPPFSPSDLSAEDIVRMRTDLVFLFLLNGNDYLPKLLGSSGFDKLLRTYLRFQRRYQQRELTSTTVESPAEGGGGDGRPGQQQQQRRRPPMSFLVDPVSLEFTDACVGFFRRLASSSAPRRTILSSTNGADQEELRKKATQTPLSHLGRFAASGYLPGPVRFRVVRPHRNDYAEPGAAHSAGAGDGSGDEEPDVDDGRDEDTDEEDDDDEVYGLDEDGNEEDFDEYEEEEDEVEDDDDDDEEEEEEGGEDVIIRLSLGDKSSEDDFYVFELRHPCYKPLKKTKHKLAKMAMRELLDWGVDGGGGPAGDEEINDAGLALLVQSGGSYAWEVKRLADGDISSYLYGLMWNLQTYQDGVCPDYAYNYGRRFSPTASDVADYLERSHERGERVGLQQLRPLQRHIKGQNISGSSPSKPLNDGLACLAALPSKVKHFVPEPYRWLSDEIVEGIYAECMDPDDNWFDMGKFQRRCDECVAELSASLPAHQGDCGSGGRRNTDSHPRSGGRRIFTSNHTWTLLAKVGKPLVDPFDPPGPFSDRISTLRPNNWIRASKVFAAQEPRHRAVWGATGGKEKKGGLSKNGRGRDFDDDGESAAAVGSNWFRSLDDVGYKVAYERYQHQSSKPKKKKKKIKMTVKKPPLLPIAEGTSDNDTDGEDSVAPLFDDSVDLTFPSLREMRTADGVSAVSCLNQLSDVRLVGRIEYDVVPNPRADREWIRLSVKRGTALGRDLSYEQERDVNTRISRQVVKQYLASLALQHIADDHLSPPSTESWTKRTFQDFRSALQKRSFPPSLPSSAPPPSVTKGEGSI